MDEVKILTPEEPASPSRGQKSGGVPTWPRLFVRVHAKARDLDPAFVKRVLETNGDESIIENKYNDEFEDIITFDFSNEPLLTGPDETKRWPTGSFRNAKEWLRRKEQVQFDTLRESGLCADFCVVNYTGLFPTELLSEVLRLRLDFWTFNLGTP